MTETKTPSEWVEELGVEVLDPDGWRYDNKSWDDPIDEAEFLARLGLCTIRIPTHGSYGPFRNRGSDGTD